MTDSALTSGIQLDEIDPATRPADDLFRHVNGRWIERTEIPADKARYGSFIELHEQAELAVRAIAEEAQQAEPGSEMRKIGDLYTSFLNEDRNEQLGAAPIRELLDQVAAIEDIPALLATVGRFDRDGVSGFVELFVDNDPGNPDRYLVMAEQGGLGLPDESYYREDSFADVREAYRGHLERMVALAGLDDPTGRADRIFALETALAQHHWDTVASRDSEKTYNLVTWQALRELAAPSGGAGGVIPRGDSGGDSGDHGADLTHWLRGLAVPTGALEEVVVRQPSFVTGLGSLLTTQWLNHWRDWLAWKVIHAFAPYLSAAFVDENFAFYGRTLSGTPQIRERWKRGVSLVEGALGEAVGKIYVERHFPPESKRQMDVLVSNLVAAYRESIGALDWMGDETKQRALDKLATFTPKIGYPATWRDYSAMTIRPDDLLGNVRAAAAFEFDRELAKIGGPIDRDEWHMTPQTINAYYNPGFNEIVFPAAILQYPFFDPSRDSAADYGAIGAVIGHEIGHGFDDQGSKFDGAGRLTDWWTEADRAAFEKRTASLIEQYDALAPAQVPDHHVNGALTIGENIGDLGGLAIAWKAYCASLGGAEAPVIDGMTAAQRFLLSWAQAWRQKGRDEETIRLLAIDPHSPNEFRCNQIVRNLDVFYEAFAVSRDDALWLDPAERVTIW